MWVISPVPLFFVRHHVSFFGKSLLNSPDLSLVWIWSQFILCIIHVGNQRSAISGKELETP